MEIGQDVELLIDCDNRWRNCPTTFMTGGIIPVIGTMWALWVI